MAPFKPKPRQPPMTKAELRAQGIKALAQVTTPIVKLLMKIRRQCGRCGDFNLVLGGARASSAGVQMFGLQQLTVNARRIPKQILNPHPPDQRPQIGIDLRPTSKRSRFPAPVAAKTGTMPAHDGLGPNDCHGLEY